MDSARVAEQITTWVRNKFAEAGAENAVIGLSGGIDSALVAALCQRALGTSIIGVLMPCHSDPRDRAHALWVARMLGIETVEVGLDLPYDSLVEELPPGDDLARANLKPRLRMLTLYYIANNRNGLVMGTGNKVELQLGYFTKYGDGGADLLPIGALNKAQVRELAAWMEIPTEIIQKPPSAGLWPGQTDEAEIGLTYDQLDAAIAALEGDAAVEVAPEVLDKVRQMRAASAHKRAPPPICPVNLNA